MDTKLVYFKSNIDGREYGFCPYDCNHVVLRSRLMRHLHKCHKNHPHMPLPTEISMRSFLEVSKEIILLTNVVFTSFYLKDHPEFKPYIQSP